MEVPLIAKQKALDGFVGGHEGVASRIRAARKAVGLTQGELAARLHVHRATVAHWERDESFAPSIEHLRALSRELQVGFEWLVLGEKPARPEGEQTMGPRIDSRRDMESRLLQLSKNVPVSFLATIIALLESACTYLE